MFFFLNSPSDDSRSLESNVGELISQYLSGAEQIIREKNFKSLHLRADYWLPDGCECLGWSKKTAVEVKYRLSYSLLARVMSEYSIVMKDHTVEHLVIVVGDRPKNDDYHKYLHSFSNMKVSLYSINDLQNRPTIGHKGQPKNKSVQPQQDNIDLAKNAFECYKHTWFLGAGLSMDAKLPSWPQLLKNLLKSKESTPYMYVNEHNSEAISDQFANSAIITGRYIFDGYRNAISRHFADKYADLSETDKNRWLEDKVNKEIVDRIRDTLYVKDSYPSDLIDSVCHAIKKRRPEQIITYNYDDLLETQLSTLGMEDKFYSVYNKNIPRHDVIPIYHVHGMIARDADRPSMPVLSEKEYHHLYDNMHNWANVIQLHSLNSTSCFFVGFSMTDPNQRRLLDFASFEDFNSEPLEEKPHFVFLKKSTLEGEAYAKVNEENSDEIEYMMNAFGLNVIWYNEFDQLPKIIDYISGKSIEKPII